MSEIFVAGVGMTRFARHPDSSMKDLTRDAVTAACTDAGCEIPQIEAAFFGNCVQGHMEGQDMIRGQIALRALGLTGVPVINVENACATATTAFHLACNYVSSGMTDIVLAVGAEKMFSEDRARMLSAFDGAWDVHDVDGNYSHLADMGKGVEVPEGTTSERPYSVFMDVYAGFCRMHMANYGTTQRQIAQVASKNHLHSEHNPLAQYTKPMSIEDVLAGAPITYPLTTPMCSPISDGAAAAIICNEQGLTRLNGNKARAIKVLASVLQTGSTRRADDLEHHVGRLGSLKAYEAAGLGPQDMDVAEVHDATAMGEIMEVEALGFCPIGEGGPFSERGETTIGGKIPVNTSGGLESKGHPIGATGLGQIYELVLQLRGEADKRQVDNAKVAIAQNGGGIIEVEEAVAAFTILGR
ncbi:MAG: thiolase family protein [Pseudomonadota bacterium]